MKRKNNLLIQLVYVLIIVIFGAITVVGISSIASLDVSVIVKIVMLLGMAFLGLFSISGVYVVYRLKEVS